MPAFSQAKGPVQKNVGKEAKVEVLTLLSQNGVNPDSVIVAALVLKIKEGWHINTADPKDETMIATSAEIANSTGVDVASISYPHGVRRKFAFTEEPIEVYEGTQTIIAALHVARGTPSGPVQLPVEVSYQACNNELCLAPATQRVIVTLNVVPPTTPISRINEELFRGRTHH